MIVVFTGAIFIIILDVCAWCWCWSLTQWSVVVVVCWTAVCTTVWMGGIVCGCADDCSINSPFFVVILELFVIVDDGTCKGGSAVWP